MGAIFLAVVCCSCCGSAIFFPILFACTLPEDAYIKDTYETACVWDSVYIEKRWCCQYGSSSCSKCHVLSFHCFHCALRTGGCSQLAITNGKCSVLKQKELGSARVGNNTIQECCNGRCCAYYHQECDTCEDKTCTTDQDGEESCTTSYSDCRCVDVCSHYDDEQGSVQCGTCRDYMFGFHFTYINNQTYTRNFTTTCGLVGSGKDDADCHRAKTTSMAKGKSTSCWVDPNINVLWAAPGWNAGCWVGIVIGAIGLLPAALLVAGLLLAIVLAIVLGVPYIIYQCVGSLCEEFSNARDAAKEERRRELRREKTRNDWKEACCEMNEMIEAMKPDESGQDITISIQDHNSNTLCIKVKDTWTVAILIEELPLCDGVSPPSLKLGGVLLEPGLSLRRMDIADGAILKCSVLIDMQPKAHNTNFDISQFVEVGTVLELVRRYPRAPSLEEFERGQGEDAVVKV